MKYQLVLLICLCGTLSCGCAAVDQKLEELFPTSFVAETKDSFRPKGSWQKADNLPEDLESMMAPIDAILMAKAETGAQYDPKDADYFWRTLYLFLGMYSEHHLLVEANDNTIRVPRQVAQEYATALFYEYDDLPPVPESQADFVTYSDAEDAYYLGRGDRGLSETTITRWAEDGDGAYYLEAELRNVMDDTVIASGTFLVQKNEYTDGMTNPVFFYSVSAVAYE